VFANILVKEIWSKMEESRKPADKGGNRLWKIYIKIKVIVQVGQNKVLCHSKITLIQPIDRFFQNLGQ